MSVFRRRVRHRVLGPLAEFVRAEAAGGLVLLLATAGALVWANSGWSALYEGFWAEKRSVPLLDVSTDLRHWVNDGLMTLFFFVVGLEIKRELVTGELRDRRTAVLPAVAAVGGVVVPAALFLAVVGRGADASGWGIPVATDIAFALGVLAVLGDRVPSTWKLFLLSVAIVDDIIAIVLIAVFYTAAVSGGWVAAAGAGLLTVVVMRRVGVTAMWPYALVGVVTWYLTYRSGVHATIAGVVLALLTPARPVDGRDVLRELEHRLHPVVVFAVVPVFALANAGISLDAGALRAAATSAPAWGVSIGLLAGKTLGIGVVTVVADRFGLGRLPEGMRRQDVWGLAALAGIGFTVSLFITDLAYDDTSLIAQAKVGIFAGSLASGLLGTAVLLLALCRRRGWDADAQGAALTGPPRGSPGPSPGRTPPA